ncbi:hypothetical protein EC988_004636 [Linderina pennispora]|nr:hypothetical protein EC988_004636 [Linderina pennispora]
MADKDIEMTDTKPQVPDSVRYRKLLSVLDRSLSSVVDTFRLEDLQEIFPQLAKEIPTKLADSHEQISSYLRNSANGDFQAILMQYAMAGKLADLDNLVADAAKRWDAGVEPVADLSPEAVNRSRAKAIKKRELERLKAKLAGMEAENRAAIEHLEQQRSVLAQEQKKLEASMELADKISA